MDQQPSLSVELAALRDRVATLENKVIPGLEQQISHLKNRLGPNQGPVIQRCPPEILRLIFAYLAPPNLEPLVAVGNNSPWSQAIRATKTIVLVCRSWWSAAIETLYKDIYLHRIGQLPSLLRTLEASQALPDGGLGKWVIRIKYEFYVVQSWSNVYCQDLTRLFRLCPSLRTVVHNPRFNYVYPPVDRLKFLAVLDVPFRYITDLTLGEGEWAGIAAQTRLLASFQTLQRLEISIDKAPYRPSAASPDLHLTLPLLHTLVCDIPSDVGFGNLEVVSRHWSLPALRHATVRLSWSYGQWARAAYPDYIANFCAAHGARLASLRVDNRTSQRVLANGLTDALHACPRLEHLVFPPNTVPLLALLPPPPPPPALASAPTRVHAALRRIDLFAPAMSTRLAGPAAQDHFAVFAAAAAAAPSAVLPALRTVRLLDPRLRGARVDGAFVDDAYRAVLLLWIDRFAAQSIRLENPEGHLLAIRDPPESGSGSAVGGSCVGTRVLDDDDDDDDDEGSSDSEYTEHTSEFDDDSDDDEDSGGGATTSDADVTDDDLYYYSTDSSGSFPEWEAEGEMSEGNFEEQIDHDAALAIFEETLRASPSFPT